MFFIQPGRYALLSILIFFQGACLTQREDLASGSAFGFDEPDRTTPADGKTPLALSMRLGDASQGGHARVGIILRSSDPCMQIQQPPVTDETGHATGYVTTTQPGESTVEAAFIDPDTRAPRREVQALYFALPDITHGTDHSPPLSPGSALSVAPPYTAAAADQSQAVQFMVVLRNATGEPLRGVAIKITPSRAGDRVRPTEATTDDQGRVLVALSSSQLGEGGVTVRAGELTAQATVRFVAEPPSSAQSSIQLAPQKGKADGIAPSTVQISVRDASARPVPNSNIRVASSVPTDRIVPAQATTDAAGRATVQLTGTQAGSRTVTAFLGNSNLIAQTILAAGPPSSAKSTLVFSPSPAVANGRNSVRLTGTLQDVLGNAIAQSPVTTTSPSNADVIVPLSTMTDTAGRFEVTLTSTKTGTRSYTVSCNGGSLQVQMQWLANTEDIDHSRLTASPNNPVADGTSTTTLSLTLKDQYDQPVAQVPLHWQVGPEDTLSMASAQTAADGTASAQIASTRARWAPLAVSTPTHDFNIQVQFKAGPAARGRSSWVVSPNVLVADGNDRATLTLKLADTFENPLTSAAVSLPNMGPRYTFTQARATTDANGIYGATVQATLAGNTNIIVAAAGLTFSVPITFIPGPAALETSSVAVMPESRVANGVEAIALSAVIRDATSNPISNLPWTLSTAADSNIVVSPSSGTTSHEGTLSASLTSTKVRAEQVRINVGGLTLDANVAWTTGPAAMAQSTFVANPNVIEANNIAVSHLVLSLADAFGNPASGTDVAFGAVNANYTISPSTGQTDVNGTFIATLQGHQAGNLNVILDTNTLQFVAPVTLVPGPVSVDQSSVDPSPTRCVADGNQPVQFMATLRDDFGNPVPNVAWSLTASGTDTSISPPSGLTSETGMFTANITSTTVQFEQITLQADGAVFIRDVEFTLGPIDATTSTFVASPSAGLVANHLATSTLTLQLRDSQSRNLPNVVIGFNTNMTDATLSASRLLSDDDGSAQTTLTSWYGGPKHVTARAGDALLATDVQFVRPTPACNGNIVLGTYPVILPTGGNPSLVRADDMDNDGNIDLIYASNFVPQGLSVFSGTGDGNFLNPIAIATPDAVQHFIIVDLDNDGAKDLVASMNTNKIQVNRNTASRTYAAGVTYTLNGEYVGLCAGDIDGDGYTDVVAVSPRNPPGFGVFIGDHAGGFASQTFYPMSGVPMHCVARDFNADGYVDLAITNNSTQTVDVYLGNAAHTYSGGTSYPVGANPNAIVSAQFDNGPTMDLAVANGNVYVGTVSVLLGQGDGTFASQVVYPTDPRPSDMTLVDTNGDGHLDILVAAGYRAFADGGLPAAPGPTGNTMNILTNNADGTFQPKITVPSGGSLESATAADFNHDGNVDLAFANSYSNFSGIAFGLGNQNYASVQKYHSNLATHHVFVADFNGDGVMDLATGSAYDQQAAIWLGQNDGKFGAPQSLPSAFLNNQMGVGDFDGDGRMDVIGINNNSSTMVMGYGRGDGTVYMSVPYQFQANNGGAGAEDLMVGDLDGDGRSDLVYVNNTGTTVSVFLNQGSDVTVPARTFQYPSSQNKCWNQGVIADINQDGYLDLILPCKNLLIYLGDGQGGFGAPTIYSASVSEFRALAVGDVNQDGYPDVIVENYYEMNVFTNTRDGNFSANPPIRFPNSGNGHLVVADLNGDGFTDIVKICGSAGVLLYTGNGTGDFSKLQRYPSGVLNRGAMIDYNLDGRQDLVTTVTDEGLVFYPFRQCVP